MRIVNSPFGRGVGEGRGRRVGRGGIDGKPGHGMRIICTVPSSMTTRRGRGQNGIAETFQASRTVATQNINVLDILTGILGILFVEGGDFLLLKIVRVVRLGSGAVHSLYIEIGSFWKGLKSNIPPAHLSSWLLHQGNGSCLLVLDNDKECVTSMHLSQHGGQSIIFKNGYTNLIKWIAKTLSLVQSLVRTAIKESTCLNWSWSSSFDAMKRRCNASSNHSTSVVRVVPSIVKIENTFFSCLCTVCIGQVIVRKSKNFRVMISIVEVVHWKGNDRNKCEESFHCNPASYSMKQGQTWERTSVRAPPRTLRRPVKYTKRLIKNLKQDTVGPQGQQIRSLNETI